MCLCIFSKSSKEFTFGEISLSEIQDSLALYILMFKVELSFVSPLTSSWNLDEMGHHFGLQINTAKNIRSNVPCLVEILIHFCNNNPFGFFETLMFINQKTNSIFYQFFTYEFRNKIAFIILIHRLHIVVTYVGCYSS